MAFAGPLRHGGFPISKGTRYILVLFMYADAFPYQKYLQQSPEACMASDISARKSGVHNSYVVYRETLELMSTLNKIEVEY